MAKTFKINGIDVSASDEQTILEVARERNIFIPTLCALEGLSFVGACRLCVVEIEGNPNPMAACATVPQEGMEIRTDSERLQGYRRLILEMLFAEGNHVCAVCVVNGHCELQWLAQKLGMTYNTLEALNPPKKVDASHYRYAIDHNRCILCTRCVRVCDEIEGAHIWDVSGRGINSKVITELNQPWGESVNCTSCGKCINVCPTGALFKKSKAVAEMEKDTHFLRYFSTIRENER
ncbi:MAG: bidirectional hydrogenase complex protein HoxU [Phototrophicales bacterium]|nr:bidirectional hydrogenase complex protein HoxU [Phototrophicales bacterium]